MIRVQLIALENIKGKEATEEIFLEVFRGDDYITTLPSPGEHYSMRRGDTQWLDNYNLQGWSIKVCVKECDRHDIDSYDGVRIVSVANQFHHSLYTCNLRNWRRRLLLQYLRGEPIENPVGRFVADLPTEGDVRYKLHFSAELIDCEGETRPEVYYCLRLHSIRCENAQERTDEVYIKVDSRQVWGVTNMRTDQEEGLEHLAAIRIQPTASIQLWEDDGSYDDFFGEYLLRIENNEFPFGEEQRCLFRRDSGIVGDMRYTLRYSVTRYDPNLGTCE